MALNTLRVKVHSKQSEADGIISLELRPVLDAAFLPSFSAGSHIDLRLPIGPRSYSIVSSPSDRRRYVVAISLSKTSTGGSSFIHDRLEPGMQLEISFPRNAFELDFRSTAFTLIAGGIGITPILCMYDELMRRGNAVKLLYCARSRRHAAFLDKFDGQSNVMLHFDDEMGGPANIADFMSTHEGDASSYYCCGPAPLLAAYKETALSLNIAPEMVHFEQFESTGDAARERSGLSGSFQVVLARSGRSLDVNRSDSILDSLLAAGVEVDFSCREGNCGACETTVLEGVPEHLDTVLTEAERRSGKSMMVCVSGCKSERIVLDL